MVRDVRHDSAYLFGAICPDRGVGAAIIMPTVNIEAMNEGHLEEFDFRGYFFLLVPWHGWPDIVP
jgi:hypothetical protein